MISWRNLKEHIETLSEEELEYSVSVEDECGRDVYVDSVINLTLYVSRDFEHSTDMIY